MPKVTFQADLTVHFDHYKDQTTTYSTNPTEEIEINRVERPSNEDLEEWIWEHRDEWKED